MNPQEEAISMEDILKKKWKVYRVSPIYNFVKKKMKLYENKLSEYMNSKVRVSSIEPYKCRFRSSESITLNKECPEHFQVEVTSQSQTVYLGNFLSWEKTRQNVQGFISLPILLVEGKGYEITLVHSYLCKLFDCDIQPVTFSFCALITFFVKMLESPRKNNDVSQEVLNLEYRVPGCKVNDNIKVTLFLDDSTVVLAVIMENLRERNQEITNMEIIWEFYNRILNHIYNVFQMDLMLANLQKVSFPDGYVTVDGELKMSTNEAAVSAMSMLQCFTSIQAVTNI